MCLLRVTGAVSVAQAPTKWCRPPHPTGCGHRRSGAIFTPARGSALALLLCRWVQPSLPRQRRVSVTDGLIPSGFPGPDQRQALIV